MISFPRTGRLFTLALPTETSRSLSDDISVVFRLARTEDRRLRAKSRCPQSWERSIESKEINLPEVCEKKREQVENLSLLTSAMHITNAAFSSPDLDTLRAVQVYMYMYSCMSVPIKIPTLATE